LKYDIENHFDPGLVQGQDQFLEFRTSDRSARSVSPVGAKKARVLYPQKFAGFFRRLFST
jgi:hypothetical protein